MYNGGSCYCYQLPNLVVSTAAAKLEIYIQTLARYIEASVLAIHVTGFYILYA